MNTDENNNNQKTDKIALKEGAYLFIDNTFMRLKTGYEKMLETLKPGEIEIPSMGGVKFNNYFG